MEQASENPPPTPPPADEPSEAPPQQPVLDLYLTQLAAQAGGKPLYRVKTLDWLGWALVVIGILLIAMIEAARMQAAVTDLKWHIRGALGFLAFGSAWAFHKYGARAKHNAKFVFTKPDDACRFVRFTEIGVSYGVPKVWQAQYAWIYFNRYTIVGDRLTLIAGGFTLHIELSYADSEKQAQIRAGLARAFARPRIGLPFYIRHCMGCGYDLATSPGPKCPECGRPFHKYNYHNARAGG